MVASVACAIHCFVFPLALSLLQLWPDSQASATGSKVSSVVGIPSDVDIAARCEACCGKGTPWFHWGMLAFVVPVAAFALYNGYRRHKQIGVAVLGAIGLVMLVLALLWGVHIWNGEAERLLTVSGSIMLTSAHFWNHRQGRCCSPVGNLSQMVEET